MSIQKAQHAEQPAGKVKGFVHIMISAGNILQIGLVMLLLSGCASYGVVHNQPGSETSDGKPYSVQTWAQSREAADFVFVLTFSGGGTRAAAMAYGVLQELRDTTISLDGNSGRLLDEVTHISSVSGGSFTSSYYGLYGDRIFEDFEEEFLRKDVEGSLTRSLFRPIHWFSRKGRTERAAEYYNKILFHDATFADMMQPQRPMIIINASDLAYGIRFSFVQDYFDLLCSDIRDFPVASAVTASSAVPVVFNPVVVENYSGCDGYQVPPQVLEQSENNRELEKLIQGLQSYRDKESRKYIHMVDGGITDNMGLRAMTDVMAVSGGPIQLLNQLHRKIPRRVVFLSVNASTEQRTEMDKTIKQPSMMAAMNAMTDVQLHRYNETTVDLVTQQLESWTRQISTPEHEVKSYFIEVSFEDVTQPHLKLFLNKIPTSFSLEDEQVDTLISSARTILREDPKFQQLLNDIANP